MSQKVLTDSEMKEVSRLAEELKRLIDENFLDTPNPEVHEKVQAIRKRLSEMGFGVSIQYNLHLETLKLDSVITLLPAGQIQ